MQLVIFIGLQGAGKSTFYKRYFVDTHIRLNQDMLKTKYRQKLLFEACMTSKTKTVIDKINVSQADREQFIQQAIAHKFEVVAYYFNVSIDDAIKRNNQRSGQAKIPEIGIRGAVKRLEKPSFAEGFHKIYSVQVLNNDFAIKEIQHEV